MNACTNKNETKIVTSWPHVPGFFFFFLVFFFTLVSASMTATAPGTSSVEPRL